MSSAAFENRTILFADYAVPIYLSYLKSDQNLRIAKFTFVIVYQSTRKDSIWMKISAKFLGDQLASGHCSWICPTARVLPWNYSCNFVMTFSALDRGSHSHCTVPSTRTCRCCSNFSRLLLLVICQLSILGMLTCLSSFSLHAAVCILYCMLICFSIQFKLCVI